MIWYIVVVLLVIAEPIPIIQHMSPLNGNEYFEDRMVWAASLLFTKEILAESLQKSCDAFSPYVIAMILSGIWNLNKGDYRNKMLAWDCRQDPTLLSWDAKLFAGKSSAEHTLARFSRYHTQVGTGVGMLLAAGGSWSLGSFGYLLIRTLFNGFVALVKHRFLPYLGNMILSIGCGSVVAYVFTSFA
jgi:hypothetical protein